MSLSIIQKLDALVPNPECVYSAIESILPLCEVPEAVDERTRLTVKLAICEFEAAHIEYPPICLDETRLYECTQSLENRATWWTSFSGNYRHLSTICSEYKSEFEAQKAANLFRNLTNIQQDYQEILVNSFGMFQDAQTELTLRFKQLVKNQELAVHQMTEAEDVSRSLELVHKSVARLFDQLEMFSDGLTDSRAASENSMAAANDLGAALRSMLDYSSLALGQLSQEQRAVMDISTIHASAVQEMREFSMLLFNAREVQARFTAESQALLVGFAAANEQHHETVGHLQEVVDTAEGAMRSAAYDLKTAAGSIVAIVQTVRAILGRFAQIVWVTCALLFSALAFTRIRQSGTNVDATAFLFL